MPESTRALAGLEDIVIFAPGDAFTGVTPEWLAPRLRLDPAASPVDLMDGLTISIDDDVFEILDGDLIQDVSEILGSAHPHGELVSYDDGGIIGGRYDVIGGWIRDWSPEVRHELVHLGQDPDLHALAQEKLVEGTYYWEAQDHELFNVDSPYLSAESPGDVEFVLGAACDAGMVSLNGTILRATQST